MYDVIVIGGGAAGMMAACTAASRGLDTLLLEKNEKLGKKIYITGKGRCNFTNACDFNTFIDNVVSNPRFMYSSLRAFGPQDMIEFLEESGCRTRVERGQRAFPVSDHASDVTKALAARLHDSGAEVRLLTWVDNISRIAVPHDKEGGPVSGSGGGSSAGFAGSQVSGHRGASGCGCVGTTVYGQRDRCEGSSVSGNDDTLRDGCGGGCREKSVDSPDPLRGARFRVDVLFERWRKAQLYTRNVIIATGGLSYPSTGSDGDGYSFAQRLGHSVRAQVPALLSLKVARTEEVAALAGVSLKNVSLSIMEECGTGARRRKVYEGGIGEMVFTHTGISGPLVLSASSYITRGLYEGRKYTAVLDLKPALSLDKLDERLLRDLDHARNMELHNALSGLLITALRPVVLRHAGIAPDVKVRDLRRRDRQKLVNAMKALEFTVTGTGGFEEAVVTQGGVMVDEVNPRTMESRLVEGLFFAGEVLDVDALTGGFNLQIAWSTGHAAGMGVR